MKAWIVESSKRHKLYVKGALVAAIEQRPAPAAPRGEGWYLLDASGLDVHERGYPCWRTTAGRARAAAEALPLPASLL